MEEVGVEAVVKGLQAFLGDMGQVNGALNNLRPSGSLLQQMFENVGSAVTNFGQAVWDVASVTLGVILRDAIEGIISSLGDLIQSVIDSGNEFQMLSIRLNGLNLPTNTADITDWTKAMGDAKAMTQDELQWIQTLGAATPFDPATIANIYTMARVFGQTDEEARRLTKDITDFGAGQALSNADLTTTIQNFGQIIERGKIMGQTVRNLTRSAFLPWDDIVTRMAKDLGITKEATVAMVSTAEGVPADVFIKAFEAMVEEEPKFIGAAGRLARALIPASENVKEIITSIFGLNVTKPIFDIIGEKVASITDQFVSFNQQGDLIKTQKWTDLVTAATNLGKSLGDVINGILGLAPSAESIADTFVKGVQGVSDWVEAHKSDIVGFFKGIADTIQNEVIPFITGQLIPALVGIVTWVWNNRETILGFFQGIANVITTNLIPFIQNQLLPAFNQISDWVTANSDLISGFFYNLGQIIATVFSNLTGGNFTGGDALKSILDSISQFMAYVIVNKDQIAQWATILIQVFVAVQLLITIFNIVVGVLITVGGFILSVVGIIGTLISIVSIASAIVSAFGIPLLIIVSTIVIVRYYLGLLGQAFAELQAAIAAAGSSIMTGLGLLAQNMITTVLNIANNIRKQDWLGVGKAIIQGMINGVSIMVGSLMSAVVNAAVSAYNAAKKYLGIKSPSTLFMEMGELTMQGMAQGIENMAGLASQTMTNAVSKIAMPAITMPSLIQTVMAQNGGGTTNNTDTKNFNLTVNSSANTEPILQDFNMLSSLAGN